MKQKLTKRIGLLAMMLLTAIGNSFAFEYGGLTYRVVDNDAKTVKVSYQGSDAWSNSYTQSSIVIPSTVPFNGDTYTVVEIGEQAFTSAAMSSVIIPATVKTIGNYAFQNCKYLTTIDLSSVETFGNYIMSDCYALTSVQLPKTMQSIPQGLLSRCTSITSFTFPDGVTSIEYDAFNGTGLTSIDIPESVTSIGSHAFANTALTSITTSVPAIDEGAFENCVSLTNITLYASYISKMGPSDNIFLGCNKINKIICLARNDISIFGFSDDVKEIATVIVPESQVTTWKNNGFLNVKAADITNVGGHVVDVLDDGMAATGGTVVVNGKMADSMFGQAFVIEPGKDVELEFIPNTNYGKVMELDKVTINGIDVTASLVNGKYTIKSISGNQLIKATWKEGVSYNVTYSANDYSCGSLYVNNKELSMYSPTASFPANQDITIVIKPNAGYSISYFRIDMMDKMNELTANTDGTYSYTYNLSSDVGIEIGYIVKPVEHEYVDLGLPSGTLWATMNIGASAVEDSGDKFAWGETTSKTDYNKGNYIYYSDTFTATKYNDSDGLTELQNSDDAAYVNWGAKWCTPTKEDWIELKNSCSLTWTSQNGVNGYEVKSNSNGNTIFLPVLKDYPAGRYWSSTRGQGDWGAYDVAFDGGGFYIDDNVAETEGRHKGENVRPVRKKVTSGNIDFADANVKAILVAQSSIDTNGDGEISYSEAEDVTKLGKIFQCQTIVSFDELQYFTGLTSIDDEAFKGCTNLTSITIPNSVTTIGVYAFSECYSLRLVTSKISNPFDVNAFDWSCTNATLVVPKGSRPAYKNVNGWTFGLILEEGETSYAINKTDNQGVCYSLRQADDNSFYYAVTGHSDALKPEIVIPADIDGCPVKTIDIYMNGGVFEGCNNLISVKILGNHLTTIGYRSFYGCTNLTTVKLGNSVRSIGEFAFSGCTSLTSITLPKNLESIGNNAFGSITWDSYCPITSIVIPHSVKTIGYGAFQGCHDLALVSFEVDEDGNTSLTSIGDQAFSNCSFASIIIPNSVTTIGNSVFANNSKLTTVILGKGITEIKDGMFQSCTSLTSFTIPDGVTSIGNFAFQMCGSLTSVKLPESLTSIGEYVFDGCQLKSIELPNSITTIPANLFNSCDLQYIKLGNNVKSIGKNAFGSRLDEEESIVLIEIGTSTPPTIASDAFPQLEALSIINVIVPDAAAVDAYRKAAVWKEMTFTHQNNVSEVTVDTPGELDYELITECNMQPAKVVSLKVKGTINAKDFDQMRTNMKSLLRLDLSECDITEIPEGAMQNKIQLQKLILPNKLKTIGNYAFKGSPYLTGKLDLPSGVTSIGDYAFEGTYYTSVALPNKLQTIGSYAFYNLPIKQKIILPDALTSIGDYAFAETQISGHAEFPDGIKNLGMGAFRNTQINPISLPDNPNGIKSISRELFQGCTSLNYIYIPRNITEVSGYAFDGCSELTYVRMSPNLETLSEYAFQNTQLEYLKVPSKVEVLSEGVLKNCKNLVSLSLPANLKEVRRDALRGCDALRNLSVEAIQPPTVDKTAMIGVNTDLCIISIPTQSYKAYVVAEYWGQFVQMRNDIDVETEGNGEIAFESVEEGEEETAGSRRRAQSVTEEESMTIANNGSSLYVPQNGKVRFIIIPGEGEKLLSATLDGEDIMPYIVNGVYTATADKKNAKLVVKFSGTIVSFIPGDVNGDNLVNVTDIVATVNYIMEKPSDGFNKAAADLSGDGDINVTDIVKMVSIIMNGNGGSSRRAAATSSHLVINRNNIQLRNAEAYTAAQFDINLSDGQSISNVVLNVSSDHSLYWKMVDANTYRVVVYSMTNAAFRANSDNLFTVFMTGVQNATISNELLIKADGTTGIDAIRTEAENGNVYDLNGRQVKTPRKGVYIINGRKVVVK